MDMSMVSVRVNSHSRPPAQAVLTPFIQEGTCVPSAEALPLGARAPPGDLESKQRLLKSFRDFFFLHF